MQKCKYKKYNIGKTVHTYVENKLGKCKSIDKHEELTENLTDI